MSLAAEKTVRELVLENSAATRVFEELGIDYCCGGQRTLERACELAGVPLDRVAKSLQAGVPTRSAQDWGRNPCPR